MEYQMMEHHFNSMKVRLIQIMGMFKVNGLSFQFHEGSINTVQE